LQVLAPASGASISRGYQMELLATGIDRVDVFLEPDRDQGGRVVASIAGFDGPHVVLPVSLPAGSHTLYVHGHSSLDGSDIVVSVACTVA
jgi:hypothetical protein